MITDSDIKGLRLAFKPKYPFLKWVTKRFGDHFKYHMGIEAVLKMTNEMFERGIANSDT